MGSNNIDLAKDTVYVHPSEKQCNYSVDTSGFATKDDISLLWEKVNSISSTPVLIKSGVLYSGSVTLTGASYVDLILSTGGSGSVSPSTVTLSVGESMWYTITSGNSSSSGQLRFVNDVLAFYMASNYCTVNYKAYG